MHAFGPGLVAVFVGGTSGIGESTARAFVRHALSPHVYLIGRNAKQASKIIKEMRESNSSAEVRFIKKDISLLRAVDEACREIQPPNGVNLLFLSSGISKGGEEINNVTETEEGLNKKLSLHYYARMRFVVNLLPQLTAASPRLSRVVSVLGAGGEGPLILDDLSLKSNYSLRNCSNHAITMTSLAMEELAQAHPSISFIHTYPGVVNTGLTRDLGSIAHMGAKAFLALASPWVIPLEESGERHLYISTSANYLPQSRKGDKHADIEPAMNAYFLDSCGLGRPNLKILRAYHANGISKKVMKHTMGVFDRVL
ncbi:uncharacterized protein N7500_000249 [Penicillium coprophilum]|uniref:uncharacterized protein n=1 Tax=Penicillium coprophilum TaxID=36646 RepID=UPI002385B557|nr:uncharacterized protein N7500_000249 [Penicillium coprophilum]KAJ5177550.1 hypothetical protein N7500_000249 [Penicillium coprophilum]